MSTKTRRRKKDLTKDNLARLAALNASAVTLMQKGVRSEQMISTMLHSLQLFKQKRLAGVVPIAKLDENELPENLQEILSLKIEDLQIDKRVKNYFLDNGAWYLGEAFQFLPFRGSHTAKSVKVMEEYVISLGLPADLKPLEAGWRPPYWDDSIAMKALNIPLIEDMIDKTEAAQFHKMDINYFGEMINSRGWRWRLRQPDRVQRFLHGRPAWNGLHAMMYLPPDWEPPKEPPPSLQKLLDEERKREEERIRERAKLEAQNRPMHSYHVREMALLFKSVEDLELSIRAMNDLRNFGIVYFGDLISCPIERLARRNIGNKSIKEIQEALVSYDLKLFMDPKENPYLASFLCWRKAEEARLAKQDN